MGTLSPEELATEAMHPTWVALHAVKARDEALVTFLHEELPADARYDVDGMNAALALTIEFNEIWHHHVPTVAELVQADRAGRLETRIAELNEVFAQGK